MSEYHQSQQHSPPPTSKPGILLPPLSKYYYGPAQGWNSTDSSPYHITSSWSLNHHDISTSLPYRFSPRPPAVGSTHGTNKSFYAAETSQGWHSPSPAPSESSTSQLASVLQAADNDPRLDTSQASVNATWDNSPPSSLKWGVIHNQEASHASVPTSKPPLPSRFPYQIPDRPVSPESKTPTSRLSTTTIEVPFFLQPVAYDPASAPPLPSRKPLLRDMTNSLSSLSEPERLPPPPPQKIPLRHLDTPQAQKTLQRYGYDEGQQKAPVVSQRPRFDIPNLHNDGDSPHQWQSPEQRPTIPTPQFTSFNVESALPPRSQPEQSLPLDQILSQSTAAQYNDLNRYEVGEFLHRSSISPAVPRAADFWVSTSTLREPEAVDAASPEQRHAILSLQDGYPTSTDDHSIKTVDVSILGSHRTSRISCRDNENRKGRGRPKQQGDDSFYWHSGRSSSDTEEDQDQSGSLTATPGGDSVGQRSSTTTSMGLQHGPLDLPIRSTSLSPTAPATYGASALGFGGPSDWEYFGDYEAEEIDDEELYSRPRPRNSRNSIRGSSELLVDSLINSTQTHKQPHLQGPDLIPLGALPLHRSTSPRNLKECLSKEGVVQELKVSLEDEHDIDAKSPVADGSVTHRPASCQLVSSSNTYGQQRPDLDDVIRAWSEAPYIGKVHEVAPSAAVNPENDGEPATVIEASPESTSHECMLGEDVVIKGAPFSPKSLKDSLDPEEPEFNYKTNISATQNDAILIAANHVPQLQPLSNQQELPEKDMVIAKMRPQNEMGCTSESENPIETVFPQADVMSSGLKLSIPIDSSIDKMSLDANGPLDKYTDSGTHDWSRAAAEQIQRYADQKSHGSFRQNDLEQGRQMVHNVVQDMAQGDLELERAEDCKETNSKPHQIFEGNIPHAGTTVVPSETIESLSGANSPRKHLAASPTSIPRTSLGMKLDAENSIKLGQDQLREDEKTSNTHTTSVILPLGHDAAGALAQVTPSPPASGVPRIDHAAPSGIGVAQDPYSDLDPWSKASLNRFAAMLREESRAENNQDKLNIFNVFASRESRLRVILYGTDDELIIPQKPRGQQQETIQKPEKAGFVKQAVERANLTGLERSLKALPALPAHRESLLRLHSNAAAPSIIQHDSKSKAEDVHQNVRPSGDDLNFQEESEMENAPLGDDSYIMVESPSNGVEYSPGGRPVIATALKTSRGNDIVSSQDVGSACEEDNATSSSKPGSSISTRSASSNGPIALRVEAFGALENPAYPTLKHNEARSEVRSYLANRKSLCRPYATLTQGSSDCVSTFGKEEGIKFTGAVGVITAPTSQYNSFSRVTVDGAMNKLKAQDVEMPNDLRRFVNADFDPLLLALPTSDAIVHVSSRILDLRNVMEAIPDDFSFIHQSVVAWDAKTKRQREENDRRRHARQAASEQKIDSLFDDHEIGYGDIAELETEFKRSEAARKADEDRFEYQTFVSDVFDLVWRRLHYELDQLIPHYDQYSKLMDDTLAGKEMFGDSEEGLALGPTMSSFLALHQKIEIRHQKAFEAVLERDRRLKKTEISPWYTLSNIAKVKQLEKQFEDAEKKAIIEYCQQRDARANHLMDVLDQNTLRGVGANQDYMEAIMKAVRRIASGRAFASVPGTDEPTAGLEEVKKARAITALLASSSEQIVQTFHVADMLLNSADYEVHVAKAKVAKADMATLTKLKEERAKEDQKLMRDLEHRLALIREDTRRTNDEIVKLMLFLGVQNGRADSAPVQAEVTDREHETRIQKALEEAKRRNALKGSGG